MVRGRAIIALPYRVAKSSTCRTYIRVRIVSVDAPRLQNSVDETLVSGPANVIDDLVTRVLLQGFADPGRDVVEGLIPRDLLPFAIAATALSFHGIQDAVL